MGKKGREGTYDGGPGSKFKLNGLKGGQGPTVVALEQTVLNIPQDKVDTMAAKYEAMVERMFGLIALKIDDLEKDPKSRSFTKLNELANALLGFQQTFQVLAGYTTKSLEVPVEAFSSALAEKQAELGALDTIFSRLDAEIERLRAMEPAETGPVLQLPSGAVTIGEYFEPETKGKLGATAMKRLISLGYATRDGKYTGKEPPAGAKVDLLEDILLLQTLEGTNGAKSEVSGGEAGGAEGSEGAQGGEGGGPGAGAEGGPRPGGPVGPEAHP